MYDRVDISWTTRLVECVVECVYMKERVGRGRPKA
jgi:hypothetical protein